MEEGIETQELKEKLDEAAESAEGAEKKGKAKNEKEEHKGVPWMMPLSLTTALIAVMAAISSLESGALADDAILKKNDAVMAQGEEDDQWTWFQAKSTREALYASQAKIAAAVHDGAKADELAKMSADEGAQKDERQAEAEKLHQKVVARDHESDECLHHHHAFARSVTIFQVAIALSAVAALTKKKPVWWLSLAVGAGGLLFLVQGFWPAA